MQELNIHEASQTGCLLRLFWMLYGYAIVFLSLGVVIVNEVAFPAIHDGVVWLTVALMSAARHIDISRYEGTTAIGEPATLAHWRSYTATIVLVTAAASAIAHVLGR